MLDIFVQHLLALMLSTLQPGQTVYSQIPIDYCDDNCQKTELCQDASDWKCRPPRYDSQVYKELVEEYVANGHTFEDAARLAKPRSFTRPESYEEGLVRYVVIAKAVADSSFHTTMALCNQECNGKEDKAECKKACAITSPWFWDRDDLAIAMLTTTKHESGWRADVHGGVKRGDCTFRYPDGRWAKPGAKGASMMHGTCRSVCLGQINLGRGYVQYAGNTYRANDLVGLDYGSTNRCMMIVARNLARSRNYCSSWVSGPAPDWASAMFSQYGSGSRCNVPKLFDRASTFHSLKYKLNSSSLDANVLATLSDPNVDAALQRLLTSSNQITWMSPIDSVVIPGKGEEIASDDSAETNAG